MYACKSMPVVITTFINPHLFWFFELEDYQKRLGIEKELESCSHEIESNPTVGKAVLVHDDVWKRAIVRRADAQSHYSCWFVDYGVLRQTTKVYTLPERYNEEKALIRQAALNNVVCVKEHLTGVGIEKESSLEFTLGVVKRATYRIESAARILFYCANEVNNIHVGEVTIITRDGHFNLSETLIEEGLLARDNNMFLRALDYNGQMSTEKLLQFPYACTKALKHKMEPIADMVHLQGVGRGRVTSRNGAMSASNRESTRTKKAFLEKWVEQSKTGVKTNDNVESDDEKDVSPSLKYIRKQIEKERSKKQKSLLGEEAAHVNVAGQSDQISTPRSSKSATSDEEPGSRRQELISDQNSSVNSETPESKIKILKNALKAMGRGRNSNEFSPGIAMGRGRSSNESSPDLNLQVGGIANKNFITPDRSPQTSRDEAKSTSVTNGDLKHQNTSKVMKWSDFGDGDDKNLQTKPKHLNVPPSGMTIQLCPAKKKNCNGNKENIKKYVSESPAESSSEDKNKHNDTGDAVSEVSTRLSSKSERNNTEQPRPMCVPTCKCTECNKWNSDVLFELSHEFTINAEPKQRKACVKPSLLFKTETLAEPVEIKRCNYITPASTRTERAIAPKLLVHGTSIASPIKYISDVPFHPDIHRALSSYDQVYTIQSFSWQSILRHMNVCLVNSAKTGKTMAYLPAICSYLLEKDERYKQLPQNTISPIAVILCGGSKVAEKIYNPLLKLVDYSRNKPVCALAVSPLDKQSLAQFQKQCDILVTTPTALVSLLATKIITMKRLCHFIMEDGDAVLKKFQKETDKLFKLFQSMLSHRSCNYVVQFIVTAEHWTVELENLMKSLTFMPLICIGSYFEAALYGRVDLQIQFLESQDRMSVLAKLLKDKANVCKTIVMFKTDSEIAQVEEYLQISGVPTVIIYDGMEAEEIVDAEMRWLNSRSGKHYALLCTDQIYNHSLHISNAVLLVHYSLPQMWSQFKNRFGCLLDNYISPLMELPNNWTKCIVHIFVDESCTHQFPKMMELMQRLGKQLPPIYQNKYSDIIEEKEKQKIETKIKLCSDLKLFGKCSSYVCTKRHVLSPNLDYSSYIPKSGVIKFQLLYVQDVTSITVKLLQHTDSAGKVHNMETYDTLHRDLQKVISEEQHYFVDVKPGAWYAVYSVEHQGYCRCAVQKIRKREKNKDATHVTVRLLDIGVNKEVTVSTLHRLPEKFCNIPPLGIDIYLANMVPPDLDQGWSSGSKAKVFKFLSQAGCFSESTYGVSQVLLQLGNVIWVNNILFREDLTAVNATVTRLNFRRTLQDQNLINGCEDQLVGLYEACKKANIELPDYNLPNNVMKVKSDEQVQPQWAFFENADYNEIYIASAVSPSLFYVRLKKFYDLFENLQTDIQASIAKPFYPSVCTVELGRYYLAKDPEGDDFCRIKINEIKDEMVEVFFVDFGDTATVNKADIKYLSDELIMKLPFQVIECRLYGIEPAWNEWEPAATDILCEYIFEPNTDYYRTLYVTTSKQEPAEMTGGQKCAILLVDNFNEKIILINQLLIDCGEAVPVQNEDLDKEFKVPEKYVEEDEDDLDEDISIDSDKDFTFEELQRLKDKYGNNNQEIENAAEAIDQNSYMRCESSQSNESRHSWTIEVNDKEAFLKLLCGVDPYESRPRAIEENNREFLPMRALPPAQYSTPNVMWYQTEKHIKLNIVLPGSCEYQTRITRGRIFTFQTTYANKQYKLELQLFSKVEKTFQHSSSGLQARVTLTKLAPTEWPRLVISQERFRHIKYDVSQCVIPEEPKKPFLNLGKDLDDDLDDGKCGVDFEFGSDEDYDESDPESSTSSD